MKKLFAKVIFFVVLSLLWGNSLCVAQQNILLNNYFSQLELSGNLRVNLIPSQSDSTRIEARVYGTSAQRLQWKEKGSTLKVELPSNVVERDCYADLDIYYTELTRLKCDGVSVEARDTIFTESLLVDAQSSINKISLNVVATELKIRATGNSVISVAGRADWLIVNSWLGARVDCLRGTFGDCVVKAQQSSEVVVSVRDRLDAHASGKASIFYHGDPNVLTKESIGGAVVPVILPE
ncbi:MAG: DUF2807 domain-containing protein [Rikenellaceae bacterium]